MKVLLHIGTPKTGSTSIQSALSSNYATLADSGILYPRSLQWHGLNHINLYWLSLSPHQVERSRFVAGLADAGAFSARQDHIRDRFHRELDRTKPHTLVLSSEHLSMHLNDRGRVEALKAVLDELGADTTVFVYLREQANLLPSFYGEEVKSGLKRRLRFEAPPEGQTYWDAAMDRRRLAMRSDPNLVAYIDPCPQWLDYEQLLHLWSSVFGQDKMAVRRFGRPFFSGGDVFSDFSTSAGLPEFADGRGIQANVSDSAITTELRRRVNFIIPNGVSPKWEHRRRRLVMTPLLNLPGGPVSLKPDQKRLVRETFRAGNEAVAKSFFNEKAVLFS